MGNNGSRDYRKILVGLAMGVAGLQLGLVNHGPKMTVCNVGQGLGVVISEGSNQVVYDFGPKDGNMVGCLEKVMGLDRKIELAFISHEDADHIGGMQQVEQHYQIEQKIYSKDVTVNDIYSIATMQFDIKWPEKLVGDVNKDSLVVETRINNKNILLMGDVTNEEEQSMVWRNILKDRVEVVVLAHHGSGTATSNELLEKVRPDEVIISVGKNNFGHPNQQILDKLNQRNIKIMRTDEVGEIVVE